MTAPEPGQTFAHYRIVKKLGQGGQATAFQAEDLRLNRLVVLKTLRPELAQNEAAQKRFEREACLCSALDNPNICSVFDVGETDGLHYIVMQYVEGPTLKQLLAGRPLNTLSALSIAIQIADGLAVAHASGIIHRDLKPTNVIITPGGQAKVLDFGLAKMLGRAELDGGRRPLPGADPLTDTGVPYGSMGYGSPEQAMGEHVDHRTDIFSLGVLIYEMMTGVGPFRGQHTIETLHAVINNTPRPMLDRNRHAPPELQVILDRALAKRPRDRYQTMAALRDELKALMRRMTHETGLVPTESSAVLMTPRRASINWFSRLFTTRANRFTGAPPRSPDRVDEASRAPLYARPPSWGTEVKKTLAVIPFRNLAADRDLDVYRLLLADGLIVELASLDSLVVRPSSYVACYEGSDPDPRQVGEDLVVGWVLTGSFIKTAERLRVSAQLIAAATGEILWGDKVDIPTADLIAAQDTLAERVVAGLRLHLAPTQPEKEATPPTRNAEAYDFYLRGKDALQQFVRQTWDVGDLEMAVKLFNEAVGLDADFTDAHAAVGRCYVLHARGYGGPEYFQLAERALRRALELEPRSLEARLHMVPVLLHHGDRDGAEASLAELRQEAPDDPGVLAVAGRLLRLRGRYPEARAAYDRLLEVSPADAAVVSSNRVRMLLHQRLTDDALRELELARAVAPEHPLLQMFLAMARLQQGNAEDAATLFESLLQRHPHLDGVRPLLGWCLVARDERRRAQLLFTKTVIEAGQADPDCAFWLACLRALEGEVHEAMNWLRLSVRLGNHDGVLLASSRELDRLRGEPRFGELLVEMRGSAA